MEDFRFLDRISELKKGESLTAFFTLKGTEEFLLDHFKSFPVMPGVLMLESLRQAAAALVGFSTDFDEPFYRLERAEGIKFGQFVKPGDTIKLWVRLNAMKDNQAHCEGRLETTGEKVSKALTALLVLAPVSVPAEKKEILRQNARRLHAALVSK